MDLINKYFLQTIDLKQFQQDSFIIIPLGVCCSAAYICRSHTNLTQKAYAFDWAQINIDSMCNMLQLNKTNIPLFLNEYFSDVDFQNEGIHTKTKSKFPHEKKADKNVIIDKYTRRLIRLNEDISSLQKKLFVVFFLSGTIIPENKSKFLKLRGKIQSPQELNTFIVFNASQINKRQENIFFINLSNYFKPIQDDGLGNQAFWEILAARYVIAIIKFLTAPKINEVHV